MCCVLPPPLQQHYTMEQNTLYLLTALQNVSNWAVRSIVSRQEKETERLRKGSAMEILRLNMTVSFIQGKILVLTTTNGTRLLHMALERGAREIVTGSFANLNAVTEYLLQQKNNVILACAAWKDRINIEDTLFAGAVIEKVRDYFNIECDASHTAVNLYEKAAGDLFGFMKENNASHFKRLMAYGLEKDIRYCLEPNQANVLPIYEAGKLKIY